MILFIIPIYIQNVEAVEKYVEVSAGNYLTVTYPETVIKNEKFNISFLLSNSYARSNLSLSINASNNVFNIEDTHNFLLEELARGSTFGKTITVTTSNDVTAGIHYVNIEYRIKENLLSNVAIPINILAEPNITIEMQVQEHIYTNAEFPFTVSIQSDNIVLNNVTIRIIPPKEIEFRGNTVYTISHIDVIKPVEFKSMLVTPSETELDHEHRIPFQVTVEYVDHNGMLNSKSEVVMVLLRQKNIFEFNSDGGFWLGPIYVAPSISYGVIFSILGTSLWAYKKIRKKRAKRKT